MTDDTENDRRDARGGSAPGATDISMAEDLRLFLREQTKLARLQAEQLEQEGGLTRWSFRLKHMGEALGVAFRLTIALVVFAVAVLIGGALWSAAHDNGLVIEAFSVPSDLAARGLTGQVFASQMLDKLAAMQRATASARSPSSYTNEWGNDIKVQIPDTGVSVGEVNRYLRNWLGHETHITGEVYRTADGIAITARESDGAGATFFGHDADLDKLIQQAAESVYKDTQPYRYAAYVSFGLGVVPDVGRIGEVKKIYDRLIVEGPPRERAWAYIGLANLAAANGNLEDAVAYSGNAIAIMPDMALGYVNLESNAKTLGHAQQALDAARAVVRTFERKQPEDLSARSSAVLDADEHANLAGYVGDYDQSLRWSAKEAGLPEYGSSVETARETMANALAQLHDGGGASAAWKLFEPATDPQTAANRLGDRMLEDFVLERWGAVVLRQKAFESSFDNAIAPLAKIIEVRQERPAVAYAKARVGDIAGADALIGRTPLDCYPCLRFRGLIDMVKKNWGGADYWFARAVDEAPDPPFAYAEWGQMLLAKGDFESAIAKFREANAKSPHFADPLEQWGEALIAENRSDLAIAKFSEANAYAPHWGRLHLKWGEALDYAGHHDEARQQYAAASSMELTPRDRAMLDERMRSQ